MTFDKLHYVSLSYALYMLGAKIALTLLLNGRQIAFATDLLAVAHIFRRVGGETGPWQRVAINARSPYLDTDIFAPGTVLEYYVQFEPQQSTLEARRNIASILVPHPAATS